MRNAELNRNKYHYFAIIKNSNIQNNDNIYKLLNDEYYILDFPVLKYNEIQIYIENELDSYNSKNYSNLVSRYKNSKDYQLFKENLNYYIIELKYKITNNILTIDNVISVNNFAPFYGDDMYCLNYNEKLTKLFSEKIIKNQLSQQKFQFNNNLDNLQLIYGGKNQNKYLFRSCSYEEIKHLLLYDYIEPLKEDEDEYDENEYDEDEYDENGNKNKKPIFLSYHYDFGINRMREFKEQNNDYLVIYDREILKSQGADLHSSRYRKWNATTPKYVKKISGGKNNQLRIQSNREKFNYVRDNNHIKQRKITFEDMELPYAYEATIESILMTHGLIHNILVYIPNIENTELRNYEYYRNYNRLMKLLEFRINHR